MAEIGLLTTHVLDTMHGIPARGMRIDLRMMHGDHTHQLLSTHTGVDGRAEQPLLDGDRFHPGPYELVFHVGQYFERMGLELEAPFLDLVPVRFLISEASHYHVPLLCSPFAYSTYRGS